MKIKVKLGDGLAIMCVVVIILLVIYLLKSTSSQIKKFRVRDFQFYNCRDKRRIGGQDNLVHHAANAISRVDG
jgi:hypothetical protein